MAEHLLKFDERAPAPPEKRAASDRSHDFFEIYQPFIAEKARAQAARCAQCGVPFCQNACPLQNNIPDWLKLTAEGRLEEAYQVSAATNPMPEICGRICPQDRLCEGACVVEQSGHGAVTIGAVETQLTEHAWAEGLVPALKVGTPRGQSVGIVGAGPAGLAAAEALRELGYDVTIYDRHDRLGGLLVYGIPNFKLDKVVVARRAERLLQAGIRFEANCDVGTTISFEQLRAQHDAVLAATGAYKARPLTVPNGNLAIQALPYLIASNKAALDGGSGLDGPFNVENKRVVVIGGGDTAMDCVRTAIRQGAKSVTCLYRRDRANMPGSRREVVCAEEEGVRFEWLAQPKALRGGAAPAVKVSRMRLASSAGGRRTVEEAPDSAFSVGADVIIAALGFDAEDLPEAWRAPQLATNPNGTLAAEYPSYQTSLPGVFAAGDIRRGPSLVVWALREGREAADAMHHWLAQRANSARIAAE